MAHPKGGVVRNRKPRRDSRGDQNSSADGNASTEPYEIDRLAYFLFIAVPFIVTCFIGYFYYREMMRNLVIQPNSAPQIITKEKSSNMERFWGTYRPGVYFGTKTRSANSPVTGMMWFEQKLPQQPKIKHLCEQGDKLRKYGWTKHNGNDFGIHKAHDDGYSIYSEFVKRVGGKHGGDWSAKISARLQTKRPTKLVSLMYYFVTDGVTDIKPEIHGNDHLTALHGDDPELGKFKLSFKASGNELVYNHMVTYTPGYEHIEHVMKYGLEVRPSNAGQYAGLKGRLVPQGTPGPNMYIFQVTAQLPFTLEVIYESESFSDRPNSLQGDILTGEIESRSLDFDEKFESIFQLQKKKYTKDQIDFARAALSNMLGGVGFFYGSSKVQSAYNPEPVDYWEAALLTAVPSRSFFPRGFLWDEGFHNLLIKEWDRQLSMDIIGHWMDLMNSEGWIPREQILGGEARAKVPDEFVVQRNENANPPTFFLPLQSIIADLVKDNSSESRQYLASLYPRLKTWYNWFNKTQAGSMPHTYRWKGRNADTIKEINPKTLTSGLDDYPRASHPTDEERHLDLRCWMALASKVMASIAKALDEPWESYQFTYDKLSDNQLLNELHWSDSTKRYADYGLHTDQVRLKRPPPPQNTPPGQPVPQPELQRKVYAEPKYDLVTSYFGYVSLFPLLTEILEPNSEQLGEVIKSLRNTDLLWTQYGLRSLAKNSPLYQKHNTQHDPPYWRGAIWININYLTLRSLFHYSQLEGPYQKEATEVYNILRNNVVHNIYLEYQKTGYIWEQYDDNTGQGKGCHPFTGWSALVTLIMAEKY